MKNFFSRSDRVVAAPGAAVDADSDSPTRSMKKGEAGAAEGKEQYGGWDAERADYERPERRASRIGAPKRKSVFGPATTGDSSSDQSISVGKQVELEADNAIKYRTCSWQKTAALLFAEYISLAIMSFPYSYSVLGLVPGLILTVVVAALVLYTSIIVWEFCLRHPEVRDVCDIGQMLFFDSKWAWWFTAVMFILNNTFIQGFHCLTGSKYLNTVSNHTTLNAGVCTIGFSAIMAVVSWLCSMPRTFDALSKLATFSAIFTFLSVLLAAIFAGVEDHPAGFNPLFPVEVLVIPTPGTGFVAGMSAFLNITYTFVGQITLPSFIAEMKEPKDFPKALWAVTICEIFVFSICGSVIYAYTGTNYNVAPAFGSLGNRTFELVSFSFMIPTLIFLGVLYASVSARFIFFTIFSGTKHMSSHTAVGWAAWAGILAVLWLLAFIIAEVIPFFTDLLSLMSSLFDSFFGFIFWGMAYLRMRHADHGPDFWKVRGARGVAGAAFNVWLLAVGLFVLGAGTYVSVQSIIDGYASAQFGGPFSCQSNALVAADPSTAKKRWLEQSATVLYNVSVNNLRR